MERDGFKTHILERLDLGRLVTFIPNKKIPIYNWLYFKEGFSRDFVHFIIDRFRLGKKHWVLDPFLGVGTTLLACKEKSVNGIGLEVNPLFLFITDVKIDDYNLEELRRWSEWLFKQRFEKPSLKNQPPLIKKAFNKYNLEDILFFRNKIYEIPDEKARKFLLLALMRASSKITYAYKDGAIIKIIKRPTPPLRPFFRRIVKSMIRDLRRTGFGASRLYTYLGDARRMTQIQDELVDAVITSPPYLNKIEYTKVYEIEMKIFLGEKTVNPIRSYIGLLPRRKPKDLPYFIEDLNLPPTALNYFSDMWRVMKEIYRVLDRGGRVALVVGEGIFPDRVVESDMILGRLAYETGFRVPEIWVVNKRVATKDRTVKIGIARESIVFLIKKE